LTQSHHLCPICKNKFNGICSYTRYSPADELNLGLGNDIPWPACARSYVAEVSTPTRKGNTAGITAKV